MSDPVWTNRFHWCSLAAGFLAAAEGRLDDSRYVRELAYEFFETGAFRDQAASFDPDRLSSSSSSAAHPDGLSGPGS